MPKIIIGFFMIMVVLHSCKNKQKEEMQEYSSQFETGSMIKSDKSIVPLNLKSKELVASWPEYQKFADFVGQYQEIALSDALLNSAELSEMAKQLKDSIRVESLKIPSVKMRLNVLHSETMRLADMATIPTISEDAVVTENNNVIQAFSALNLKINTINSMEKLNDEISSFVQEVVNEPDSVPTVKTTETTETTETTALKDSL